MYYLTITAKRKNAKRHIASKSTNYTELKNGSTAKVLLSSGRYIVEIYNGKWDLIQRLGEQNGKSK